MAIICFFRQLNYSKKRLEISQIEITHIFNMKKDLKIVLCSLVQYKRVKRVGFSYSFWENYNIIFGIATIHKKVFDFRHQNKYLTASAIATYYRFPQFIFF